MKIIITKPGEVSKKDRSLLIKNGVLLIEANNPADVVIVSDGDFAHGDELMLSALYGIHDGQDDRTRRMFISHLVQKLKKKETIETNEPKLPQQ